MRRRDFISLWRSGSRMAAFQLRDVQESAAAIGQQIHILPASNMSDIDAAFATAGQLRAGAMLLSGEPFLNSQHDKIIALAARYSIPTIYEQREHALAGGLMSYGTNISDGYRQAGVYAGRILKGEKPGDLPVVQLTKFEFIIKPQDRQGARHRGAAESLCRGGRDH
jgi:putative ABC transport system substrate-binding protein